MVGVTHIERFHGQVPSGSPYTQDHFIATTDGVLGCIVLASGATSWDAADDNPAMFACGIWENSARTPFNSKNVALWTRFRDGAAAYLGRATGQDGAAICWADANAKEIRQAEKATELTSLE